MTSHLTEESFADLLAGESLPATEAHLAVCEPCRLEAERLCGALASFKEHSLAWGESRTRALPVPLTSRHGGLVALPHLAFPHLKMQAAAAVLLACAVVGGALRMIDHAPAVHEHAAGTLAEDNQLLLSIDQELSTPDVSPREAYAVKSSARAMVSE